MNQKKLWKYNLYENLQKFFPIYLTQEYNDVIIKL